MAGPHSHAKKIVTTFGAGLACAYLAPTAEGAIVSFTPSPQTKPFNASLVCNNVQFGGAGTVLACNDFIGKSIYNGNLAGFRAAPASNTITANQSFFTKIAKAPAASGTETFAFKTGIGQLGWFRVNWGGPGGAVTYIEGAYNTAPGGAIHSGGGAVPEPASLTLLGLAALAAGARGLKRRRENRA